MLDNAVLSGYDNYGEHQPLSHFYQYVEQNMMYPMLILIRCYTNDAKFYKGHISNMAFTYDNMPITETELKEIEIYTGKAKQVDFKEIIVGLNVEELYKQYVCTDVKR